MPWWPSAIAIYLLILFCIIHGDINVWQLECARMAQDILQSTVTVPGPAGDLGAEFLHEWSGSSNTPCELEKLRTLGKITIPAGTTRILGLEKDCVCASRRFKVAFFFVLIVSTYTDCELKDGVDKLPALLGTTSQRQRLGGPSGALKMGHDVYSADMWERGLDIGLVWYPSLQSVQKP